MIRFILATAIVAFSSVLARAELILEVGNHNLLANTQNQMVDIFVRSTNQSTPINGLNLRARLGDGSGSQGVFQGAAGSLDGVRMTGGGFFWDFGPNGATAGGEAPIDGLPAFAEVSINFNNSGSTQNTRRIESGTRVRIATLVIDTTGLGTGTYAIDFADTLGVGIGASQFIGAAGADIDFDSIQSGSFTVVPEPSSFAIVAVGLLQSIRCRYRRPSKRSLS